LTTDTVPQNPLPQSSSIERLAVTPLCVIALFEYSSVMASSVAPVQLVMLTKHNDVRPILMSDAMDTGYGWVTGGRGFGLVVRRRLVAYG
jgi:hypothetical protein